MAEELTALGSITCMSSARGTTVAGIFWEKSVMGSGLTGELMEEATKMCRVSTENSPICPSL